ncbi:MAG: alpha/beta fold hydrolase, partial [Planctomycetes bacterium]|nr:alpha/beta fold hydrolase [Planctomycetota bacterium]
MPFNTSCTFPAALSIRKWKPWLVLSLTLAIPTVGVRDSFGQTNPTAKKPVANVSEDRTLQSRDRADIKITYFKSTEGQNASVVVMLHGQGGNRQVWKGFAETLQKAGYAVVTVDLRGHGESSGGSGSSTSGKKGGNEHSTPKGKDYEAMIAGDMEAVKKFLFDEHQKKQLNMNKLGIVAS